MTITFTQSQIEEVLRQHVAQFLMPGVSLGEARLEFDMESAKTAGFVAIDCQQSVNTSVDKKE